MDIDYNALLIYVIKVVVNLLVYFDFLMAVLYTKNVIYFDKLMKLTVLLCSFFIMVYSQLSLFSNLLHFELYQVDFFYVYISAFFVFTWLIEFRFIHHMAIKKSSHSDIMSMVTAIVMKLFVYISLILGNWLHLIYDQEIETVVLYGALIFFCLYFHKKHDAYNCIQIMSGLVKVHVEPKKEAKVEHPAHPAHPVAHPALAVVVPVPTTLNVTQKVPSVIYEHQVTSDGKSELKSDDASKKMEKKPRRLSSS